MYKMWKKKGVEIMFVEILALLTIVPAVLGGILTAFVCLCMKICDFIIFPVIDFVLKLFGMI